MNLREALHFPAPLSMMALETLVQASLSPVELETLARRSQELTRVRFGSVMQLYAPLYLSNACINTCTYCGYSRNNRIKRRTLTAQEVRQEGEALSRQGIRHVLLVAGEHPKEVGTDYLLEVLQALVGIFASIAIEIAPLTEKDYWRLCAQGVQGLVIYQETYARETYAQMHLHGPKADYDARLRAPLAGVRAGMRLIGLGCLWGLHPWREDFLALIHHARQVQKIAWSAQLSLSFPRLREAMGVNAPSYPVSDRDLVTMITLARLSLPEAHLVLSTRETAALRDAIAPLGITMMSAGSRTNPGGYTLDEDSLEQFSIHDRRPIVEVVNTLHKNGFAVATKDWEPSLHGALI